MAPHALPAVALPRLQALCSELQRRGYTGLIVVYSDCGDADIRLQVSRGGAPIVELLGPYNGNSDGVLWHAVRIDPNDRSIWRGPPKGCRDGQVIEFVTDLLSEPREGLICRYRAL